MVALPNKFPPFPITPPTFFYSLVKVFHADATFNEQYERSLKEEMERVYHMVGILSLF